MSLPDFGKAVRFFQFGWRAYKPKLAEEKYGRLDRRGKLLRGPCTLLQEDLELQGDHTALISSGTGLLLLKEGRLYKLFGSMGYIFGMTVLGDRVYLLHLLQVEGNYKHSEETFRRSEIYSVAVSDILAIKPGETLALRREWTERNVLYSFCNAAGGLLYAVDYLGRLSVFKPDADGVLDKARARHVMINRHADGSPLRRYAYTHLNAVSVSGDRVYLGAHGRKAHSGRFSSVFSIDRNLKPETIENVFTPFVHAHDIMVADGDLYTCDSRNSILVRNGEKVYQDNNGFMRGLAVLDDRYLVGISVKSDRRSDRNRETEDQNHIVEIGRDGRVMARAGLKGSQIYRILVLSERDATVSSNSTRPDAMPDLAMVLAGGESRDVATYYGGEDPPFHGRIKDYKG